MQRELLSLDPNMLSLDFNVLSLAFDEVVFHRLFMREQSQEAEHNRNRS